jgi:prevent-host-death family protein
MAKPPAKRVRKTVSRSAKDGRVAVLKEARGRKRQTVPATQAKNRFGEILQAARDTGPVFIERHGQPQAVVLGIDAYNKLTSTARSLQDRELDYWTAEFNAIYSRMQTPEARRAVDELFSASDAELNRRDT